MESFSLTPAAMMRSLLSHRSLIKTLAWRDIVGRYRGSWLGIGWSLLHPLAMLALYSFVFGTVFKSRWSQVGNETEPHFALALFAGLLIFNLFGECLNRAPNLIVGNANYVKKIVFPLEIMPWVVLLSSMFNVLISLIVLCVGHLVVGDSIPWTIVLLPLMMIPLSLFILGSAWFVSALGVYVRDIGQLTGVVVTMLLFLSAVFFPLSALPPKYSSIMELNPLVPIIEGSRSILVFGVIPKLLPLVKTTLLGIFVAYLGFVWFQKSRKGFADVL